MKEREDPIKTQNQKNKNKTKQNKNKQTKNNKTTKKTGFQMWVCNIENAC